MNHFSVIRTGLVLSLCFLLAFPNSTMALRVEAAAESLLVITGLEETMLKGVDARDTKNRQLIRKAKDENSGRALDELIRINRGLISKLAQWGFLQARRGWLRVPFHVLEEAAEDGFKNAIISFEFERANKFSTHATWQMRSAISHALTRASMVTVPDYLLSSWVVQAYEEALSLHAKDGQFPENKIRSEMEKVIARDSGNRAERRLKKFRHTVNIQNLKMAYEIVQKLKVFRDSQRKSQDGETGSLLQEAPSPDRWLADSHAPEIAEFIGRLKEILTPAEHRVLFAYLIAGEERSSVESMQTDDVEWIAVQVGEELGMAPDEVGRNRDRALRKIRLITPEWLEPELSPLEQQVAALGLTEKRPSLREFISRHFHMREEDRVLVADYLFSLRESPRQEDREAYDQYLERFTPSQREVILYVIENPEQVYRRMAINLKKSGPAIRTSLVFGMRLAVLLANRRMQGPQGFARVLWQMEKGPGYEQAALNRIVQQLQIRDARSLRHLSLAQIKAVRGVGLTRAKAIHDLLQPTPVVSGLEESLERSSLELLTLKPSA